MLEKIPLFSENFSSNFIEKLAINCEEKVFSDGDIIIKVFAFNYYFLKENNYDDCSLYILFKGEAELF